MDESRAGPRFCPARTITALVISLRSLRSLGAVVLDLSERGVRLRTSGPVAPDDIVMLQLPGSEFTLARVAHAAEQPDRTWISGCELYVRVDLRTLELLPP